MEWDPQQYEQFAAQRSRPFVELLARVGATAPRRVVDLGCGPGTTTAMLARRWPDAQVEGIDSSPDMIDAAQPADRLSFRVGDIATWLPSDDADVIISNASLHWLPMHRELVARWAAALPAGGWLAFQVPGNFGAPSHLLMRSLATTPRWAPALAGVLRHDEVVATPAEYATLLLDAGLAVDAWETTYVHVLPGSDAVLQWVRGTALRPVMAALPEREYGQFEAEYAAALRAAYPATGHGTVFPFRRIFAVGFRERAA